MNDHQMESGCVGVYREKKKEIYIFLQPRDSGGSREIHRDNRGAIRKNNLKRGLISRKAGGLLAVFEN